MISETQANSLKVLKSYDVVVSRFIRQAIKEKIKRDWPEIKSQKTKTKLPF